VALSLLAAITVASALSASGPSPVGHEVKMASAGSCTLTVVLQCRVADDGAAKDCQVISEDPNALGAGAAALSMSAQFHLTPRADDTPVLLPVRIQTGTCGAAR
jgi:hypothetical protein